MNINRHNYEEFFLMYVDNELTAGQRTEVESFVKLNPDLSEELAMLQESVLVPDDLVFIKKDSLYKNEQAININNYEEYFLLDVDNELSETEKEEVEKFVLQHPNLQGEYTLLHQTKLQPEVIQFTDKASLYRNEEKERRIIPIRFIHYAAAASVVGLAAALWFFSADNVSIIPVTALNERPVKNIQENQTLQQAQQNVATADPKLQQNIAQQTITRKLKTVNNNEVELQVNKNISTPVKDDVSIAYTAPEQQTQPENIHTVTEVPVNISEPEPALTASNKNINHTTSFARPAVYKEVNADDEENSFYIGSVEINKNKLRGLMKKASSLFDKKAKNDDSDKTIQIASFEIKTK